MNRRRRPFQVDVVPCPSVTEVAALSAGTLINMQLLEKAVQRVTEAYNVKLERFVWKSAQNLQTEFRVPRPVYGEFIITLLLSV